MKKALLALLAFTLMASAGNLEDGIEAYKSGEYKKAARLYQKSADQGNAEAQTNLGIMYENGVGLKCDCVKAVEFYQMAADQGSASAQSNLGAMHYAGLGVKQDKTKAYHYWVMAANQGGSIAKGNLDSLRKDSPWACK